MVKLLELDSAIASMFWTTQEKPREDENVVSTVPLWNACILSKSAILNAVEWQGQQACVISGAPGSLLGARTILCPCSKECSSLPKSFLRSALAKYLNNRHWPEKAAQPGDRGLDDAYRPHPISTLLPGPACPPTHQEPPSCPELPAHPPSRNALLPSRNQLLLVSAKFSWCKVGVARPCTQRPWATATASVSPRAIMQTHVVSAQQKALDCPLRSGRIVMLWGTNSAKSLNSERWSTFSTE